MEINVFNRAYLNICIPEYITTPPLKLHTYHVLAACTSGKRETCSCK